MYQHLWDDALPYFSNNQWNFGRFLSHLDTLPHFPTDKKSRRELGTELWVSLLSKFAENDSHHENKFKAVQELAKIRKPSKTITNNVVNASTVNGLVNCMIDAANIAIPPNLGVKQVEVCNIPQPGDSETPSHGNPNSQASPPYDKPPCQVPTAGRSEQVCQGANSAINKPTIIPSSYAARPTNESSRVELRGPVHHLYHEEVKGIRKPSLDIALSPPTHPGVGELGGVDCSGYGLDFPESLGDETMDLIAAMGPGLMCAVSSTNSNQLLHANDELVELGVTELNMGEDVVGIRSNASSDSRSISFDKINKPSSDHVGDGFSTRGSSPAGRLPSFSGFDAIPSDCVGCCLHPPTQQLPSQCHSRAVSPAPGPLGAKILRIQSLCAHASPLRLQPPSSLNTPTDHGGEVNPRSVSPASLNEIVTPLQNLKRPSTADKAHNTYRKLLEIQSHNLNMQSHNLKMQMALNEILMDELDTWASSPSKRQRLS